MECHINSNGQRKIRGHCRLCTCGASRAREAEVYRGAEGGVWDRPGVGKVLGQSDSGHRFITMCDEAVSARG